MRASVTSNAGEVRRRMLARAVALPAALHGAAREGARLLEDESKRVLQAEVYSVPIPTRSTGRSKRQATGFRAPKRQTAWTRTGELKESERAFPRGADVILLNDSDHAVARARLGTPGGRAIVSPGVRSVQWQRVAARNVRGRVLEGRRRAVWRAYRRA